MTLVFRMMLPSELRRSIRVVVPAVYIRHRHEWPLSFVPLLTIQSPEEPEITDQPAPLTRATFMPSAKVVRLVPGEMVVV